jgi:acyl CoA:acetate/3-ketoacid CoA transferase alpha subunit
MSVVMPLAQAVRRFVRPGQHLHFASTPSRSNASVREVARAFLGTRPGFTIGSTGFHSMAHALPLLRLADRLVGCFFGDHYPAPRPNALYSRAAAAGVALEQWSLWSLVSSLRAGAQGDRWAFNRSLAGTTIAAELASAGLYREVADPAEPGRRVGLLAAMRPDLTFVHGATADEDGHVILSGPLSEGVWSALAARQGIIVTVERIAPTAWTREHPDLIVLPPHRVLAVCEEPFGAHPQPFHSAPAMGIPSYRDDFEHYERWRRLTGDEAGFGAFVGSVLEAGGDGGAAYRSWVGREHLDRLVVAPTRRGHGRAWTPIPPGTARSGELPASPLARAAASAADAAARATRAVRAPTAPAGIDDLAAVERLIVAGARRLAARAQAIGARVLLAGIGHAFFAARLAQHRLAAAGHPIRVMVETGIYDLDCGPDGHGYLLAYDNIAHARRLTSIDDILGVLGCGADNRCIAVLGAAQIDRRGNLNSTRLADGRILVGSGGACDIAAGVDEVVVMTRLGPGRLVDRVDYLTSPGRAVRTVVTDRGVLTRRGDAWTLAALAPPTVPVALGPDDIDDQVAAIRRDCGWDFDTATGLDADPPIEDGERHLLTLLDPDGTYRRRS